MNGPVQICMRDQIMKRALRKISLLAATFLLEACGAEAVTEAAYNHRSCRKVALVDAVTNARIIGAEDFAIDWETNTLFLSAHDRRAVEAAARRGQAKIPNGGIYKVSFETLFSHADDAPLSLAPLISPAEFSTGLRPHGIAIDSKRGELIIVNRAYRRSGRQWRMTPLLQRIAVSGDAHLIDAEEAPCAANDVTTTPSEAIVSFDHQNCGWRAGLEDTFAQKRSGVMTPGQGVVFDGVGFANGVATLRTGDFALSATRENAVLILTRDDDGLSEKERLGTPGAPDNLIVGDNGEVIAAVHPSLIKLALNRKWGIGNAPSRIVRIDLETGETSILFDDKSGALFSAATVAVETPHGLIAGSVTDAGLLVCRRSVL